MSKTKKRTLYVLILLFLFLRPSLIVLQSPEKFFSRNYAKNYESYKNAYYNSQYVKKKNPSIIPDEAFNAFAAGIFLKGLNPILITHDHPPLSRYLNSIFIYFFDNANLIIPICLLLSCWGLFLITNMLVKNVFLSFIPLGIFINEPLFMNKLVYTPLTEPIQFPFIVFAIYFFMRSMTSKNYVKWIFLTMLFLGFVISTRFFVTGAFLGASMVVYMLFFREYKKIVWFFVSSPLSIVVLLLSYFRTFQLGYSLIKVLGIQKYILMYHKSKFTLPMSFWDLLLFNRWHTWWGNWAILSDPQWLILWPLSVCIIVGSCILAVMKKFYLTKFEIFLLLWVCSYTFALSFGYSSTNYFLPLIPFLYILSLSFIVRLIEMKTVKKAKVVVKKKRR